ncbi:unnamed protein product [Caenorhabditis nigoni]
MKLSKFPYLVQKEIFAEMNNQDSFSFSFISKKMRQLIKSTQSERLKSISFINYKRSRVKTAIVGIVFKNGEEEDVLVLDERSATVAGKLIDFLYIDTPTYRHPLFASFHTRNKEYAIRYFHNCFLDIFGDSVKYQWFENCYKTPIPQLQNVSSFITLLNIGLRDDDMDMVETFFSSSPIPKWVKVSNVTEETELSPESKFYQAESVTVDKIDQTAPAALRYFHGRLAFLKCCSCKASDLIEFINRWKSGEAYQKLEYLQFRISHLECKIAKFPENKILSSTGAKRIDSTKKPPTHILPKLYDYYDQNRNTEPITSHAYVVRASDNRVASVQFQPNTFLFGVWDKTEEEFLKMIE